MDLVFGLGAATLFGLADFCGTRSARRLGTLTAIVLVQLTGLLAISLAILVRGDAPGGTATDWWRAIGVAVLSFAGTLLLYRAFTIGTLSLVSPIASGFSVVAAALAIAAGERLPGLVLVGVVLLIAGVTVASVGQSSGQTTMAGVPEAIGAMVTIGASFWGISEVSEALGPYWPVLVLRLVQVVLALATTRVWRGEFRIARDQALLFGAAAGVLDTAALVIFNIGVERSYVTLTTALASLYSLVTIALAWYFFQERLSPRQWAGIAIVLAGVLLVSF